jgi:hypothetical protein
VRDYVHESEGELPEAAFVRDAFQLRASDAAAKWFGSTIAAQAYIANALGEYVESDRAQSEVSGESPGEDSGLIRPEDNEGS